MSEGQSIRVGIIGCGGNGRAHLQWLAAIEGVEIVGIADPSPTARTAAREAAGQADLPSFRSHQNLLRQAGPDAVVISTPHTLHYQQIIDSLTAGCHVLCEKPMICSCAEARGVIKKVKQTGLVMGISYQRHVQPPYMYCRQAIVSGEIGRVHFVSCLQSQNWYALTHGTWRRVPELAGGGQLNDSGSHLLDIVLWMTGLQPQSAFAYIDNLDTQVDILTAMSVKCKSGVLCNFSVVGHAVPGILEDITMWGAEGTIAIRGCDVYQWNAAGKQRKVPTSDMPAGSSPDENFIGAIRGEQEIAASPECGLAVIRLTEAVWRSAKSGKPESVGS